MTLDLSVTYDVNELIRARVKSDLVNLAKMKPSTES